MSGSWRSAVDGARWRAALAGLTAAAAATRLYKLASWGISGDELATLRDSLDPALSPVKQLLFWMNHLLVVPFHPLDEVGLRLLPAVFGIAGVTVLAVLGGRLVGRRAGLLAGLLLLLNPWHLVFSQMARYYSLVFLLACVSGVALYLGTVKRDGKWLGLGVAATAVAGLAHPTGVFPAVGYVVWLATHAMRRTSGARRRRLLIAVAVSCAVGLIAAFALVRQWAGLEQEWGIGGVQVAVSYLVRLGPGVGLTAAAGVVLLWLDQRRDLALFLGAAVLIPGAIVGLLGLQVAVHTGYLFATAPFAILAAAVFLDGAIGAFANLGRRWVAGMAIVGLSVLPGLPTLVSHYLDGSRPDFRGAARHVAEHASDRDLVLTDQPGAFRLYQPELEAQPLTRDSDRLRAVLDSLRDLSPPARLWVVPHVRSQGGFGLQGFDSIERWVRPHCERTVELGVVRIDHEVSYVPVWRCPG